MPDTQNHLQNDTVVDSTELGRRLGYWLERALQGPIFIRRYGRVIAVLTACRFDDPENKVNESHET